MFQFWCLRLQNWHLKHHIWCLKHQNLFMNLKIWFWCFGAPILVLYDIDPWGLIWFFFRFGIGLTRAIFWMFCSAQLCRYDFDEDIFIKPFCFHFSKFSFLYLPFLINKHKTALLAKNYWLIGRIYINQMYKLWRLRKLRSSQIKASLSRC